MSNNLNQWISVGTLDDGGANPCVDYGDLNHGQAPPWGSDATAASSKLRLLCCDEAAPFPKSKGVELASADEAFLPEEAAASPVSPVDPVGAPSFNGHSTAVERAQDAKLAEAVAVPPSSTESNSSKASAQATAPIDITVASVTSAGQSITMPSASGKSEFQSPASSKGQSIATASAQLHSGLGSYTSHPELHSEESINAMIKSLNPWWYSQESGWSGGSYHDAIDFCQRKHQELCPYAACEPFNAACS